LLSLGGDLQASATPRGGKLGGFFGRLTSKNNVSAEEKKANANIL
jgi:hypothetical protein